MARLEIAGMWWTIDRDAKRVGSVVLVALALGALFVTCSIPSGTASAPRVAAGPAPANAPGSAGAAKPASTQAPAAGSAPAGASGNTPGAATATASTAAAPAAGATSVAVNSPRWAALLWAAACCAVGGFIGFIFGIPRSLSSDTARTAVPTQLVGGDAAKTRATTSREAADIALAERDRTAKVAQDAAKAVADATAKAERLETVAKNAPTDANAQAQAVVAKQELVDVQAKKKEADEIAAQKLNAAKSAEEKAKKDHDALAAISQAAGAPPSKVENGRGPSTAVNTNLEQISDWLTKIIVGVSLVNSEKVGDAMWTAAKQMALSIGGGPSRESLALAILVYFAVVGLLGGYLLTRLFLQRAFSAVGSTEIASEG